MSDLALFVRSQISLGKIIRMKRCGVGKGDYKAVTRAFTVIYPKTIYHENCIDIEDGHSWPVPV